MNFEWKSIPGQDGYEVSNDGQVRSIDRKILDRFGVTRNYKGRILKQFTEPSSGYKAVCLGKGNIHRVHVLVLTSFTGQRPHGMVCAHNDGNASNNSYSNLRWCSQKSNIADTEAHGTKKLGEETNNVKLNAESVRDIRSSKKTKGYIALLSKKHGVYPSTIHRILKREIWSHL